MPNQNWRKKYLFWWNFERNAKEDKTGYGTYYFQGMYITLEAFIKITTAPINVYYIFSIFIHSIFHKYLWNWSSNLNLIYGMFSKYQRYDICRVIHILNDEMFVEILFIEQLILQNYQLWISDWNF